MFCHPLFVSIVRIILSLFTIVNMYLYFFIFSSETFRSKLCLFALCISCENYLIYIIIFSKTKRDKKHNDSLHSVSFFFYYFHLLHHSITRIDSPFCIFVPNHILTGSSSFFFSIRLNNNSTAFLQIFSIG